jgi:hypothetical protein
MWRPDYKRAQEGKDMKVERRGKGGRKDQAGGGDVGQGLNTEGVLEMELQFRGKQVLALQETRHEAWGPEGGRRKAHGRLRSIR